MEMFGNALLEKDVLFKKNDQITAILNIIGL